MPRPSETWELKGCTADCKVLLREKHCVFVMLEEERQATWTCGKNKRKALLGCMVNTIQKGCVQDPMSLKLFAIPDTSIPNVCLRQHCLTLFSEKLQQHFYVKTLLCCPLTAEFLWNKIIHPGGYWENSVLFHVITVNIKEIKSCFTSYCKVLQKFLLYIYFIAETVGLCKKSCFCLTEIYQLRLHLWVSYLLYLILSLGSRSSYYHSLLKSKLKGELKSF